MNDTHSAEISTFTPQERTDIECLARGLWLLHNAVFCLFVLTLGTMFFLGVSLRADPPSWYEPMLSRWETARSCVFFFCAVLGITGGILCLKTPKKMVPNAVSLLTATGALMFAFSGCNLLGFAQYWALADSCIVRCFDDQFSVLRTIISDDFSIVFLGVTSAAFVVCGALFLTKLARYFDDSSIRVRTKLAADFFIVGLFFVYVLPQAETFSVTLPTICAASSSVLFAVGLGFLSGVFFALERHFQTLLNEKITESASVQNQSTNQNTNKYVNQK